jgi:GMP synthase-like glutamine amidotransferase
MRIFILQPKLDDEPSFLASCLQARGLGFELCCVGAGDVVPVSAGPFDAVAMLGGSMSVNDDLPWLSRAEALLRDAVVRQVPVLGHCLGGQLLAKALGARVTHNPQPEIGWSRIELVRSAEALALAQAWFGAADGLQARRVATDGDGASDAARGAALDTFVLPVYQWHSETFALPAGATLLAHNTVCAHQAFAIGPHLGMQFHIEVDAAKLDRWCSEAPPPGSALAGFDSVQTEAAMRADTARLLPHSQRVAGHIYSRWLELAGQRLQLG